MVPNACPVVSSSPPAAGIEVDHGNWGWEHSRGDQPWKSSQSHGTTFTQALPRLNWEVHVTTEESEIYLVLRSETLLP